MPASKAWREHCVFVFHLHSPQSLSSNLRSRLICWNRAGDAHDGDGYDDAGVHTVLLLFLMSQLMNGTSPLMLQRLCCLGNETKTKRFVQDALPPHLLGRRFFSGCGWTPEKGQGHPPSPLALHELRFMISLMKCWWKYCTLSFLPPKAISPSVSVRKCWIPGDILLANLIWKAHRLIWLWNSACTTLSFTLPISRVHILHLSCVHMDLQSTHFPLRFISRPSYAIFCLDCVVFPHLLTPKGPSCSANSQAPTVHTARVEGLIVWTAQVPRRHGKSCSLSPALEPEIPLSSLEAVCLCERERCQDTLLESIWFYSLRAC